jgi:hypothetical protein
VLPAQDSLFRAADAKATVSSAVALFGQIALAGTFAKTLRVFLPPSILTAITLWRLWQKG